MAHPRRAARDLFITCIKSQGDLLKFWALPLQNLETVKSYENLLKAKEHELDSVGGFRRSDEIPLGSLCVVRSKIKECWCRALVLSHHGLSNIIVQLIDYGNEELISVTHVRNMEESIFSHPAQAIECILADVNPVTGNEWSRDAISYCEQHLLFNTLSCYVVSKYMNIPIVRVAKKGENEAFVQRLINEGKAVIKEEPVTPSYKLCNMDQNTTHLVRVSCVESTQKFYVQLVAAEMELKRLMDSLNHIPRESFPYLKSLAINTPCLAQFSNKPCFYRALVTHVQHPKCKVFFVDYGYVDCKDLRELRQIDPTFLNLPAQAISCTLSPHITISNDEFRHRVTLNILECHVLSRTSESYVVKLLQKGQDILAASQSYTQQKLNVGTKCEVIVSYVNDMQEFYIQLSHYKDHLAAITSILNSGYTFIPISFSECTPGAPVCVKYSEDNLWYRAQIVAVNHESDISVFFVDYGNLDNVSLSAVRKLNPDLMKFPVQAFKCYLFDTPIPVDQKIKDDAFDLFEQLTNNQNLLAQIKAYTEGSNYGLVLFDQNSETSINEKILSLAMSIPKVPINEIENIYVTSFENPNSFFAQLEKLDSDQLQQMQNEINELYSASQNMSFVPTVGSLVCAKFNLDESFYRARVEKCLNNSSEVFFLDYGNRETILNSDIHLMNQRFTKYPEFGVQCSFQGCPNDVPDDQLADLIQENSFQARMLRQENNKWFISLTEDYPANQSVLQLLKDRKTAPRSIHGQGFAGNKEKSNAPPFISKSSSREPVAHLPLVDSKPASSTSENFKDYSYISVPPNAYRNVFVSHVVSPSEFYCQIEEDNPKLLALMKTIEDAFSQDNDNLHLMRYSVDSPCCALFEDNVWYRGKIKQIHENSCDVLFVDYGNTDDVPNSKIKKLRSDLFRYPVQAHQCKVFNVSPKGLDWTDDEINAFLDKTLDKSFVAQFVECDSNGVYAVNLVSIGKLQNDTFNAEFVSMGFGRLQDSTKTLILNSRAASTNLAFTSQDIRIGSKEAVEVTYGLNPGEIFCQLKSTSEGFKQMMVNLQNYYNKVSNTESLIDRPLLGMICVAQFHLDNAWYRAEIKKIESNKIYVFYVDYGNVEQVDKKMVRCIVQDYTALPMQAIKCHIRGIKPPGKSWIVNHNLSKYFEGNAVCNFISKNGDCYMVDMRCNQNDVAKMLINDKLALSDGSIHEAIVPVAEVPKATSTYSKSPVETNLPKMKDFVPGQLLSVTLSFVESPNKFWCQLADESAVLDQLMIDIEAQYQDSPVEQLSLKVGDYCISQYYLDEAWYRAKVAECLPNNSYKVFFFDYGNTETVTLTQVKAVLPQFLEIPPQCFECCLTNCPSKTTPEMKELFQGVVDEAEEITAKVDGVAAFLYTVTLLYDKEDKEINVSELLFGPCQEESQFLPAESPPRFLSPDVPLGLQEGYVSTVNSPQDFFIQMSGTEDTLADMSSELAEMCEASTETIQNLCVGYACCAKYSEDSCWYRAEVIAVHESTVDVLFVDYGNEDTVEKGAVRSLTDQYLQMPLFSIRCKLNGIAPVAEEWTADAISAFQQMVDEKCLGITFISKDIPALVNITKDDKEVSHLLVDMELANVETCAETDEAYAEDHLAPAAEDPLSSLPSDQSYPKRKIMSNKLSVKICYVDNCNTFYVMPVELSTELDTVMTTLELLYTDKAEGNVPDFLEDLRVSMPCVAKYSVDEAWYRALITSIDGDNFQVSFIDYGNSETTTIENLRPITPEVVKIPPIAIEVSLYGIEAISGKEAEITSIFDDYCADDAELEMEIFEVDPYLVKFFDNGDVGALLVQKGIAVEKKVEPSIETFEDSSKISLADGSLEFKIEIHKRLFTDVDKIIGNVKFCELENDYVTFYVVSENLEEELQNLQEKLQNAYSEAPRNLPGVSCMDFCATKYMEDENWYRAQVLFCDKDKVKVRFIDYGNCETVDRADIYELLPDFTIEHQFSVKCILYGLKVYKNKEIELQNRLDELVYHDLVELKLCTYSHAISDPCITSVICSGDDISEIILNEKLVFKHYIINSQLDNIFQATVEKISSMIYVFPLHLSGERDDFQFKLQESCQDLNIYPSEINIDQLYAAKHDDKWYRVSVIENSSDTIQVELVDFGSIVSVATSDFVLLPSDFCHQPLFLQPCYILDSSKYKISDLSINVTISCKVEETNPADQSVTIEILKCDPISQSIEGESSSPARSKDTVRDDSLKAADTQKFSESVCENVSEAAIVEIVDIQNTSERAAEISAIETTEEINAESTKIEDNEEVVEIEHTFETAIAEGDTEIETKDERTAKINTIETTENANAERTEIEEKDENISVIESTHSTEAVSAAKTTYEIIESTEIKDKDEKVVVIENTVEMMGANFELKTEMAAEIENTVEMTDANFERKTEMAAEIENTVEMTDANFGKKTEMAAEIIDIPTTETDNVEEMTVIEKDEQTDEVNTFKTTESIETPVTSNCQVTDLETRLGINSDKAPHSVETDKSASTSLKAANTEHMQREKPADHVTDSDDDVYEDTVNIENYIINEHSKIVESENEDKLKVANEVDETLVSDSNEKKTNVLKDGINFNDNIVKDIQVDCRVSYSNLVYDNNTNESGPVPSDEKCDIASDASLEVTSVAPVEIENNSDINICDKVEPNTKNVQTGSASEGNFDSEISELVKSIDLNEIDKSFKEEEFDINNCVDQQGDTCNTQSNIQQTDINASNSQKEISDFENNLEQKSDIRLNENTEEEIDKSIDLNHKACDLSDNGISENSITIPEPDLLSGTVQVNVSDIAVSDGSVIFAVQPLHLQEEFLCLKDSLQDNYSPDSPSLDNRSETLYCVVWNGEEWCRGKILHKRDDVWSVLLVDYGKCISVDGENVKSLDSEYSIIPPFAVWCTLVGVYCSEENSEKVNKFLSDNVKDIKCVIKILEGNEPYKISLFLNDLCISNQLLKKKLVTQKLPDMLIEPGSYNSKVVYTNASEIFVILAPFLGDYQSMFSSIQNMYKTEDTVPGVEKFGVYAVLHNNAWYRASVLSSDPIEVCLVDTGEKVTGCENVCFLLPEHCLHPPFAVKCNLPVDESLSVTVDDVKCILTKKDFLKVDVYSEMNTVVANLADKQVLSELRMLVPLSDISELTGANEETQSKKQMSVAPTDPITNVEVEPQVQITELSQENFPSET